MQLSSIPIVSFLACLLGAPAAAQTVQIDCSTLPAVQPRVQLSYPALPSETSIATSSAPDAVLSVANQSSAVVDYEIIARMHANGERAELSLGSGTLSAFGTATVLVPLDGMGINIASLRFSGRLAVEGRVQMTSGALLDRAYAPDVFFHRESTGLTRLYRREARRSSFRSGDLYGDVFTTVPAGVLGVFDGGAGTGSPGEDTGPVLTSNPPSGGGPYFRAPEFKGQSRWEFCMRWEYESIDSGFGEDHYTSGHLMKARGMRVMVEHKGWNAPKTFIASDDNGCFSFNAAENSDFVVTVYAEADLGDAGDIAIKAFPSKTEANLHPNDPPTWVFVASPGGEPRRVYYQNEASELSNLMAFGSFVFHWVDSSTSPGLDGPRTMFLLPNSPDCDGSCQSDNFVEIDSGSSNRKFLVGHEVGHWMHRQWTDDDMGYYNTSWSANSADADCAFLGVGAHAMRSKEYSVGGFIEGFAHFVSALAWNRFDQTGGKFKYYKEVADAAYADLAADNWIVDLDGIGGSPSGGVSNWMENMCFVTDGHSVEMDWLRFYWDYRTNSGVKPTHYQIFRHIQFTREEYPWASNFTAYDQLEAAIQDAALGQLALTDRFIDFATFNGVAQ